MENFASSTCGGLASVLLVCPLDVIKTRIQSGTFEGGGTTIAMQIMREDGIGGFFRGAIPKAMMTAPKLIFSFTVAQWVTEYFRSL